MKVINKFFWIICALYLGNGVKAKIRGIAGIDFPNYSTIPKTSFKCSEQQFNPGFYADVETRCQVFHYCYNHRKESFLCPPGTIYNQPIRSCDYWYSSECNLAPSFYHMNALNRDKNKIVDFMFAPIETSPNNVFEKMAALYEPKEKPEDFIHLSNDQSLMEQATGYNLKTPVIDSNKALYESELLTEMPPDELNYVNQINSEDFNEAEFNQNEKGIEDDIFLNDKQYETDLEYSEFGDIMDFSLQGNPENTWTESKDYSYKMDAGEDISSGEISKTDFNKEQLSDITANNDPQYDEQSNSQIGLTKRFSPSDLSSKTNRLRRRPKYVIIQTEEVISSPERENYNLKNASTSENSRKDESNTASISYETVPFRHSSDSYEMDENFIKLVPEKRKPIKRPFTLLPDNIDNIPSTVSPPKEYIHVMPTNLFDTYVPNDQVTKSPSKRKPIFIEDDMHEKADFSISSYPVTMIPLEVSSSSDAIGTVDDNTEDNSDLYDFLLSTELPISDTTTNLDLNEFSTLEDKSSKETNPDLFRKENFSEEPSQESEITIASKYSQEIGEQVLDEDDFNSMENAVNDIRTDFENEYDMSLSNFELSEGSLESIQENEKYQYPEFKDSSNFSPIEIDEPPFTQTEYSVYDLNVNSVQNLPFDVSDKSVLEYNDLHVDNQANNLFSEIQTNLIGENNQDYEEHANDEMIIDSALNPVEYTEHLNEQQDLLVQHYNSEGMDENEFMSLLEMSEGATNNGTNNVYYEIEGNHELEEMGYDVEEREVRGKFEYADLSENLNPEGIPYTDQVYYTDDSLSSYMSEQKEENLGVLQENETNGDLVINIPSDLESADHSLDEVIPETPNIPVPLNPTKASQKLIETSFDTSASQINEDRPNQELLITTTENLLEGEVENKVDTQESNTDNLVNQNISEVAISFDKNDSPLGNVIHSETDNEVTVKEIFKSNTIVDTSSLPDTEVNEELFGMSQINPIVKEKGIQTNTEIEQSTVINKDEFQQTSQFVSSDTKNPLFDKNLPTRQSLSSSIKLPISTKTDLPKLQFPSEGVRVPISGKNLREFQLPSRGKKPLTKTVGKSQFTSLPPLRNMQMLLSTYLSDSGVNDRSLFSSRTGKLFKSEKFSKAITFGKKLLALKRAKFNILKKYVASFNNEN